MKITPQFIAEARAAWSRLSPRLQQIARLIASGLTYSEAAAEIGIAPVTANRHVAAIKLKCRCRRSEIGLMTLAALGLLTEGEL